LNYIVNNLYLVCIDFVCLHAYLCSVRVRDDISTGDQDLIYLLFIKLCRQRHWSCKTWPSCSKKLYRYVIFNKCFLRYL